MCSSFVTGLFRIDVLNANKYQTHFEAFYRVSVNVLDTQSAVWRNSYPINFKRTSGLVNFS